MFVPLPVASTTLPTMQALSHTWSGAMPLRRMGAALLSLLTFACSPEPPRLTPQSVSVSAVSPQAVQLRLDLDVFNSNSFPLVASRVEGDVYVGAASLGRGSAVPEGMIPASGSKRVIARLDIPWGNVAVLSPFIISRKPVPYVFRGRAILGGENVNFELPFEIAGQLTAEQVVQASLKGL